MKKTLTTLTALAMVSVASAAYDSSVSIDQQVLLPEAKMTELTNLEHGGGSYFTSYEFTFEVISASTKDWMIAAMWNNEKYGTWNTGGGLIGFVIDANTQSLNVDLYKPGSGENMWTSFGGDDRKATFTENGTVVALTAGYTYTVSLVSAANANCTAQLTWTDAEGVAHTATATYNGNMNGDGSGVGGVFAVQVPEPATATLSLLALAGLAARRRRK